MTQRRRIDLNPKTTSLAALSVVWVLQYVFVLLVQPSAGPRACCETVWLCRLEPELESSHGRGAESRDTHRIDAIFLLTAYKRLRMMKASEIARKMCQTELAGDDIKAISTTSGFPEKAAESLGVFESFLLSNLGVANALEGLDRKEILALHLLRHLARPVGIDFFARIVDDAPAKGSRENKFAFSGVEARAWQGARRKNGGPFNRRATLPCTMDRRIRMGSYS